MESSIPVRLPNSYKVVTTLSFTNSKTSWKSTGFGGFPRNHDKNDEECSISAVPRRKKINNLCLDSGRSKPCEANAKHCLSWSCLPRNSALGSKTRSTVGSEHRIPASSIAVIFPLAFFLLSLVSCLPLHIDAELPRERGPVQESCNPPDHSRRTSSATLHLFPKHVV